MTTTPKIGDYITADIPAHGSVKAFHMFGQLSSILDKKEYMFTFIVTDFKNHDHRVGFLENELIILSDEQAMLHMLEAE
jgi:hypothetical protein